tara:strand:+ start:901 stop:1221 length:321 start_codon:yes stop_codon:yes gene_type:complete
MQRAPGNDLFDGRQRHRFRPCAIAATQPGEAHDAGAVQELRSVTLIIQQAKRAPARMTVPGVHVVSVFWRKLLVASANEIQPRQHKRHAQHVRSDACIDNALSLIA